MDWRVEVHKHRLAGWICFSFAYFARAKFGRNWFVVKYFVGRFGDRGCCWCSRKCFIFLVWTLLLLRLRCCYSSIPLFVFDVYARCTAVWLSCCVYCLTSNCLVQWKIAFKLKAKAAARYAMPWAHRGNVRACECACARVCVRLY